VRGIGELGLEPGDRVSLTPDPARIHRFAEDGLSIRT
jgi:multiple sugar transport system ATP-binding protein